MRWCHETPLRKSCTKKEYFDGQNSISLPFNLWRWRGVRNNHHQAKSNAVQRWLDMWTATKDFFPSQFHWSGLATLGDTQSRPALTVNLNNKFVSYVFHPPQNFLGYNTALCIAGHITPSTTSGFFLNGMAWTCTCIWQLWLNGGRSTWLLS